MAEAHPVGFQWVMEAKARGAKVIHVDPRFTRTSAVADEYVPIRAGTDIAFLGGIIKYVLDNELDFREYVVAYTNASHLVSEDYVDTEDLDGLFSGFDAEGRTYDESSWQYAHQEGAGSGSAETQQRAQAAGGLEHESHGVTVANTVEKDPTLQHPRCVYQVLKRHYARYTPEMVERVCGIPPAQFEEVCRAWTQNSGRERTTALVYSVGWTQHSTGVQYIRSGAILQLLLGNMGRPGGGILALRGHASIQGSTDVPTLFNLLPGYLPMPHAHSHGSLQEWVDSIRPPNQKGFWGDAGAYAVSLLKSYWGDAATAENDYGYDWVPRIDGDHGTYAQVLDMIDGKIQGYFLLGQNPAIGSAHGRAQRLGMANLDWLVVRDLFEIESATFWRDSPEVETGEIVPTECRTEVFLLPAASHVEKEGTFTQTQRMLQWREQAVEPQGDCRSELWFFYHLGRMVRERLAGSTDPRDAGLLALTWDYPVHGEHDEPSAEAVLMEINGVDVASGRAAVVVHRAGRGRLHRQRVLDLLRCLRRRREPGGAPQARVRAGLGGGRVGLGLAGEPADPVQPRVRRPGRQPLERAQEVRLVGRRAGPVDRLRRPGLPGDEAAGLRARPRTPWGQRRSAAVTRSSCRATARGGCSRRGAWSTGRCRRTTRRPSPRSATRCTASRATRRGSCTSAATTR